MAVVAVERCEWLNVVVDCTGPAFVAVESSRTDYLLLTEAGAAKLNTKGISIDNILEILPTVVRFYELKIPRMRSPSVDGRPFLSLWLATRCAVSKVG